MRFTWTPARTDVNQLPARGSLLHLNPSSSPSPLMPSVAVLADSLECLRRRCCRMRSCCAWPYVGSEWPAQQFVEAADYKPWDAARRSNPQQKQIKSTSARSACPAAWRPPDLAVACEEPGRALQLLLCAHRLLTSPGAQSPPRRASTITWSRSQGVQPPRPWSRSEGGSTSRSRDRLGAACSTESTCRRELPLCGRHSLRPAWRPPAGAFLPSGCRRQPGGFPCSLQRPGPPSGCPTGPLHVASPAAASRAVTAAADAARLRSGAGSLPGRQAATPAPLDACMALAMAGVVASALSTAVRRRSTSAAGTAAALRAAPCRRLQTMSQPAARRSRQQVRRQRGAQTSQRCSRDHGEVRLWLVATDGGCGRCGGASVRTCRA